MLTIFAPAARTAASMLARAASGKFSTVMLNRRWSLINCCTSPSKIVLPRVEHGDPVADFLHLLQQMRAEQHRLAHFLQPQNHVANVPAANWIDARPSARRARAAFGIVKSRLRQADALEHALRVTF